MVISDNKVVDIDWSSITQIAQYKTLRKSDYRKLSILTIKMENPDITLQAIGDKVGCTREYVRIVLKDFGVSTYRPPMENKLCLECQEPISRHRAYRTNICKECSYKNRREETVCPNCQKVNLSLKSHIKRNTNTFCNNNCQFSYMGKTYGFRAHPENSIRGRFDPNPKNDTTNYWLKSATKRDPNKTRGWQFKKG
jgi:hypothetical protein|tara:strand:- start:127 stop:714 length:588 start_codon:yes stop_codon:yes gene_type:complete